MDDYRDVDESYRMSLEKIIMDAGLKLPSIWGNLPAGYNKRLHDKQAERSREK